MPKKRKVFRKKPKQSFRRSPKHRTKSESFHHLSSSVLAFLYKQQEPVTVDQIFQKLKLEKKNKKEIEGTVLDLLRKGDLISAGKKRFRLNDKGVFFGGQLVKNPRGFGFVTDLKPRETAQYFKKDPFISINRMRTANHDDHILIRIIRVRKDDRPEAEIIAILKRGSESITGFYKNGEPPHVVPEDPRFPSIIQILHPLPDVIEENTVVIVQVLPTPEGLGTPSGKIIEVLGPAQNIDVQMRIVIEKHNLPHIFPDEVIRQAAQLSFSSNDLHNRLDLRATDHITIDGETAKDFDDAVAVEKTDNGYRLYVSIADVSHFVQPGTPLDKEAYNRGTSIYFPGRVIPMLPEKLSNNLCSLVPHEDRLTFSAILDFNTKGVLLSKKFSKSVICSKNRFTYTTVKQILIDRDSKTRSANEEFLPGLECARELAEILYNRRMSRGSIGFNIPEPEISLENDGNIKAIVRKERNFAHQIIEEFMLAANEAVAELFTNNRREFIYRIHEKPALPKVEEFISFAKSLSIDLPPAGLEPEPSWFAKVLEIVKGSPAEYVVNNLLLRTMQQARYDSENQGHFGLAATDYTHFTSPIRRYPDLLVHRFLTAFLQRQEIPSEKQKTPLKEKGYYLSSRERTAITAERDINDRLKVFYMEKFIGQTFKAVISGIIESAIFVELLDLFISGSIDITTLQDDYYLFDIKRYRFIGEISGKTYTLGDQIEVILLDVNHRNKRINFSPSNQQATG